MIQKLWQTRGINIIQVSTLHGFPGGIIICGYPEKYSVKIKLIQFPVSVTPHLRIPLFWLAFKNMPYALFLKLTLQTLRKDGYVCLYFHPWEFIDLANYKITFLYQQGK